MSNLEFYLVTLAIFACLNGVIALGFNLQFGVAGIMNLAYIVLVAVGAYMTAIAGVHAPPHDGVTSYIGGFGWPFPLDVLFGTASAVVFAVVLGGIAFRRLRHDYLALALVAIGEGLQVLVSNDVNLFNGGTGIAGIPGPGESSLNPDTYQLVFLGLAVVVVALVYLLFTRTTDTPLGRVWRGVREDEDAVASLGKNPWPLKMTAFLVGAAAAGLGGGLLATYTGGWNASSWLPSETLALLAAIIIGGRGRNAGAIVGAGVVMGVVVQASTYLPQIGSLDLLPALQQIVLGVLLVAFLWLRPQGLLPEQKERFRPESDQGESAYASPNGLVAPVGVNHAGLRPVAAAPAAAAAALELRGVSCSYGGLQAVNGVSFVIEPSTFVGLIGPNGAGKTTLIDCISGMNRSYQGTVLLWGQDISRQPLHRVAALSLLRTFQIPRIFRRLTVLSNLMIAPRQQRGENLIAAWFGTWKAQEASLLRHALAILADFDLTPVAENYGADLSGGQERLVELARTLMQEPRVLLLDEPFAGVSPANRVRLAEHLKQLWRDHGVTIVMVEHRLEWVEHLCDRVIVMANGQVVADGPMADLRRNERVVSSYLGA